jgi:hypothetical protein
MGERRVTAFSASHTVDKISMTEIGNENVNLSQVVERSVGVLNKGAELRNSWA